MVILHHTVIINELFVCGAFRERVEEDLRSCCHLTPLAMYIFTLLRNVYSLTYVSIGVMITFTTCDLCYSVSARVCLISCSFLGSVRTCIFDSGCSLVSVPAEVCLPVPVCWHCMSLLVYSFRRVLSVPALAWCLCVSVGCMFGHSSGTVPCLVYLRGHIGLGSAWMECMCIRLVL